MNIKIKINIPKDVEYIINELDKNNYKAYIVGGAVRDSILGRNPKDWDITTNAKPEEVIEIFENCNVIPTGIQHGTVTIMINDVGYEVTTYRTEGEYSDGRHPDKVEFVSSLKEDLSRRDFTINSMAYNSSVGLVDYFDGIKDLNNKVIKCVGDPNKRFEEDKLRVMRAIRFSAQLDFKIDSRTICEIISIDNGLEGISIERIRDEFNKILISDSSRLDILYTSDLTNYFIPEFDKMERNQNNPYHHLNLIDHTFLATNLIENELHLKLTMLLHDIGKLETETLDENDISHYYNHAVYSEEKAKEILTRMKYDNTTIEKVLTLIKYHDCTLESNHSIKKMLNKIGEELLGDLIKVKWADILAQNPIYAKDRLLNLVEVQLKLNDILVKNECFSLKDLNINGRDLMEELNLIGGKQIGEILNYLLDKVLESPELNIKETLLLMAKEWNSN